VGGSDSMPPGRYTCLQRYFTVLRSCLIYRFDVIELACQSTAADVDERRDLKSGESVSSALRRYQGGPMANDDVERKQKELSG
jgi:hypothetical protein